MTSIDPPIASPPLRGNHTAAWSSARRSANGAAQLDKI
jgi:hypothetical protein